MPEWRVGVVSEFVIRPMTAADAQAIAAWRYPEPYAFYNADADPADWHPRDRAVARWYSWITLAGYLLLAYVLVTALIPIVVRLVQILLERLGDPPLWAAPLHWYGLHAALLREQPSAAEPHVAALMKAAKSNH